MKEILIYGSAAVAAIFLLGYSVHMMIGGLVSAQTEFWAITITVVVGVAAVAMMAYDVIRRRTGR